jgi:hypothetical protein
MKMINALKTRNAESVFLALAVIVVLLILPMFGATAMLAGSVIALTAFIFVFRERLRARGWLTVAVSAAASAALAAAVAIAVSLIQPR